MQGKLPSLGPIFVLILYILSYSEFIKTNISKNFYVPFPILTSCLNLYDDLTQTDD